LSSSWFLIDVYLLEIFTVILLATIFFDVIDFSLETWSVSNK
jgi:hypothetical protein